MKDSIAFLKAIKNNAKINIENEEISLSNIKSNRSEEVYFREVFDGNELVISGVTNLELIGNNKSEIFTNPSYATVLNFELSDSLKLHNLKIGHKPELGECEGGVLDFKFCHNILLDNLILYGCGTYGIEISSCTNIVINKVIITDCTYGIFSLLNCKNILFSNCIFENNKSHDIYLNNIEGLEFDNCIFRNNEVDFFSNEYMFNLDDGEYEVKFKNCTFEPIENSIKPEERDILLNNNSKD